MEVGHASIMLSIAGAAVELNVDMSGYQQAAAVQLLSAGCYTLHS